MSITDGLEDKLSQILNDPQSMAQILSLAQSLGMSPEPEEETPQEAPSVPPVPEDGFVRSILALMQQTRRSDSRQEALLCALKPFLAPHRREKLDRALRIARISHLAGAALSGYGDFPGLGGL